MHTSIQYNTYYLDIVEDALEDLLDCRHRPHQQTEGITFSSDGDLIIVPVPSTIFGTMTSCHEYDIQEI
jgi:hypothetical protein